MFVTFFSQSTSLCQIMRNPLPTDERERQPDIVSLLLLSTLLRSMIFIYLSLLPKNVVNLKSASRKTLDKTHRPRPSILVRCRHIDSRMTGVYTRVIQTRLRESRSMCFLSKGPSADSSAVSAGVCFYSDQQDPLLWRMPRRAAERKNVSGKQMGCICY